VRENVETLMAVYVGDQPIPARYCVACELCGRPLDVRDKGVYQHTRGWVMNRAGGGGHGVSLPERDPRWAHGRCVERAVAGTLAHVGMFGED
jgi:hypothetical protein